MARLESVAVAGYYPTPAAVIPRIAALIDTAPARQRTYDERYREAVYPTYGLLDPAAGDGSALIGFAHALFGQPLPEYGHGPRLYLYACELEAERAQVLRGQLQQTNLRPGSYEVRHSDAFQITWTTNAGMQGVDLLWLNPPYDSDVLHGRLEHAFLTRFTAALTPGAGILIFIVPYHALATSAAYLAQQYEALAGYRFPDDEFAAFKQVVVLARRRRDPLLLPGAVASLTAQITAWAADATRLPVLPTPGTCVPILALAPGARGGLSEFAVHALDVARLLPYVQPWTIGTCDYTAPPVAPAVTGLPAQRGTTRLTPLAEIGVHLPLDRFLHRVLPVAMPPKPAYLALLLASGMLNGLRVEPDDPAGGLPPILVKGRFSKDFVTVKENRDKKGTTTSVVQVQQPTLKVVVLTLATPPRYIDLAAGTTPTGCHDIAGMNIADLLQHYGRGLAWLIAQQFPALHDPANPGHALPLPPLGRPLFRAQAQVVQSTLKLLGQGHDPFILGEVGTGKSMQSLAVAAALSPQQFATTRTSLQAAGLWTRTPSLRPVRRVLVLSPPHLLASWVDQVALALPGARAVRIERIRDLHTPAPPEGTGPGAGMTIYILSRETAKLGAALRAGCYQPPAGPDGRVPLPTCPRCGAPVTAPATEIVERRLRCTAAALHAQHPAGALAVELAQLLVTAYPDDETIQALLPARILQLRARFAGCVGDGPANPDSTEPLELPASVRDARWRQTVLRSPLGTHSPLGHLLEHLIALLMQLYPQDKAHPHQANAIRTLLRSLLLLHLAAPTALLGGFVTHTVRLLYPMTLDEPADYTLGATIRETLVRLLLLLLPSDAELATVLAGELQAYPLAPSTLAGGRGLWTVFAAVRKRLITELAGAAGSADATSDSPATEDGRPATHVGSYLPVDWPDLAIDPATGGLCWRDGGAHYLLGSATAAHAALAALVPLGRFVLGRVCNEPLYQAEPRPRRVPLARYIARRCRTLFDLVILDEVHEFNTVGSAQEHAAHLLAQLPGVPVLGLSGSLTNGYSSSLFANFRAFCRSFRAEFGPHDKGQFVQRFGYLKILKTLPAQDGRGGEVRGYGKQSLRTEHAADPIIKTLGEAPGVLPLFLPLYLLPNASIIHKADLDIDLPPLREQPVALMVEAADTQGQCLLARYAELQNALLTRVKSDRFTELSGRLLGALTELPSFLELGTNDTGNALDARGNPVYEIRYSANCGDLGGTLVASVPLLPATMVLPKERWMLEQVRGQLARGRNVLIFLRHTGNLRLVTRYQRLLRQELGVDAGYLNSSKVLTGVREAWIRREVLARRQRVLLVNPESIKTGLNCLAPYFKTAIWMELTYNVLTMRQANGRIHRIGADPAHPIEILVPVYAGTAQEVALELIARKLSVSMQMDGLDVESQLEAAGAGDADSTGIQQLALMNMGQAIFDILEGHAARSPVNAVPMTVATPALPDGRNGALFSTVEPELASPPVPLSTRPRPSMVARTLPAGSLVGSHPVAIQQYKQAALVDALPMHLPAIPSANSPAEPQPMVAEQGHATPLGSAHPTRVGDGHRYRQSTLFDGMPAT